MHPLQAIIDLGTNTFHLMLFSFENNKLYVYDKQQFIVKLGEGGINQKKIAPAAFDRGILALKQMRKILDEMKIKDVKAFATSAIRNATNGKYFIEQVKILTGIKIEIIDGNQEAELISKGVIYTLQNHIKEGLIMDIGGGSVEFVIFKNETKIWHRSYEIGTARLVEIFHNNDPITLNEVQDLESFLTIELEELIKQMEHHQIDVLVGSAGSFESLVMMTESNTKINDLLDEITLKDFYNIYETIINSSILGRKSIKGLEDYRIEMIVVAIVLMNFIIHNGKIKNVFCSNYALKEGAAISFQNLT